jgi:hypothetical protein
LREAAGSGTVWSFARPSRLRNGLGLADSNDQDPLQSLDIEISTVLLDSEQPAGGLITHLMGPRLFRVSQWWVKPDHQSDGAALLLHSRVIEGALTSSIGYTMGSLGMELCNTPAIHLCAH